MARTSFVKELLAIRDAHFEQRRKVEDLLLGAGELSSAEARELHERRGKAILKRVNRQIRSIERAILVREAPDLLFKSRQLDREIQACRIAVAARCRRRPQARMVRGRRVASSPASRRGPPREPDDPDCWERS